MKINRTTRGAAIIAALLSTQAAAWPERPVRMVNPFTPGGGVDVVGRLIAQQLAQSWGQPVITDNRPGAGTTLGMEIVARAQPDGYTLLVTNGSVATAPSLYPKLSYNVVKDLAPVSLAIQSPYILTVHPSVKVTSVQELINLARAQPGKLSYGSVGVGSLVHLMTELFKSITKTDLLHVPYKGGAPSITGLLSGEIQVIFSPISTMLPHIKSGKARALAVSSAKRVELAPDLPSVAEAGIAGYDATSWYPYFAPGGTPAGIVQKISGDIDRVLQTPEVRARFLSLGMVPVGGAPQVLRDYLAVEIKRWGRVIADTGVKAE
ncbi:MAG: tripartite tricarboxylate transporter substrate binding protein [Betaproteobacteria bacterium]|nr:tripartite tricarboxylate transporter substrate binding protein [Betaproteobacteria bacterium]